MSGGAGSGRIQWGEVGSVVRGVQEGLSGIPAPCASWRAGAGKGRTDSGCTAVVDWSDVGSGRCWRLQIVGKGSTG